MTGVVKKRHGGLPEVLVAFATSWSVLSRHYLAGYVDKKLLEEVSVFSKNQKGFFF